MPQLAGEGGASVIGILAVLLMTLCGSLGALFFKRASGKRQGLVSLLRTPQLYLGGCFYGVGALLNIVLLNVWEYSIVYPLTAITYVWTLFLSNRLLGERLTRRKVLGVLLVFCGVVLLTR